MNTERSLFNQPFSRREVQHNSPDGDLQYQRSANGSQTNMFFIY